MIVLKEILENDMAITQDQAKKIVDYIKNNKIFNLEIDVTGMEVVSTGFFNIILDHFLTKYSYTELVDKHLKIKGANDYVKYAIVSALSISEKNEEK